MNLFEEAVLEYLTHEGDVFLCPQYPASGAKPDFVALNFAKPQVEVVEVCGAYDLNDLAAKLNNRGWVEKLVAELRNKKVIDGNWKLILRVFVAKAYRDNFCKKIGSPRDAIVETIDDVFASLLDWQKQQDPRPRDAEK
jgi:hypothetical protein